MTDHSVTINEEVKTPFPSGFAEKVHRDWIKSDNPETIVTCKQTKDVQIFHGTNLCCRSTSSDTVFNWNFRILARGKYYTITLYFLVVFTFAVIGRKSMRGTNRRSNVW